MDFYIAIASSSKLHNKFLVATHLFLKTSEMESTLTIGFIGAGQMATALIKGFVSSGLISATNVVVSAPSDRNLAYHRNLGCQTTHNNVEVIEKAAIVFFAVKPHLFPVVMKNLKENCQLNEK